MSVTSSNRTASSNGPRCKSKTVKTSTHTTTDYDATTGFRVCKTTTTTRSCVVSYFLPAAAPEGSEEYDAAGAVGKEKGRGDLEVEKADFEAGEEEGGGGESEEEESVKSEDEEDSIKSEEEEGEEEEEEEIEIPGCDLFDLDEEDSIKSEEEEEIEILGFDLSDSGIEQL